jgi:hypothetical protein
MGIAVGALAESGAGDKLATDSATAHDKWKKAATASLTMMKDHFNISDSYRKELEAEAAAAKEPTAQQKAQAKQLLGQAAQAESYSTYDQGLADELNAISADLKSAGKATSDATKRIEEWKAAAAKGPGTAKEGAAAWEKDLAPEWKDQTTQLFYQSDNMKKFAAELQNAANGFKNKATKLRAQAKKLDPTAK